MIDSDIALLYGVTTRAFNQAVKRNLNRFPKDFMFQLNQKEYEILRSQFVISNRGGRRYLPYAFTEQGVAMLSGILNSEKAIEVNIAIMRTFVLIRQYAMGYKELQEQIEMLEKKYHKNFEEVFYALNLLLKERSFSIQQKNREPVGFKTKSK